MLETFKNAWRIEEIRKKILYTLGMLLLYRVGVCLIPVAGVDSAYIAEQVAKYDILGFLNLLTGGSLQYFTIFAMGVTPYITASIVLNLLTFAIPALERMAKEGGDEGRDKIARITRYTGIGLALLQSLVILNTMKGAFLSNDILTYITAVLSLTAGTAITMWIGEKISENGIGNGISLIIFVGIVSRLPQIAVTYITSIADGLMNAWTLVPIIVFMIALVAGVVYIDSGERRIPVQYAKRVVGRKMYGGQSTHIPMKLNGAGVMPIIFAMTLLQFPGMIAQFWAESSFSRWYASFMNSGGIPYSILFALLILAFSFFYSTISFNPVDVSKNIQQYGGFIPGIRPGKPTSDYLYKVSSRLTFFGGVFLALLATVPTLIAGLMGIQLAMTATGLLITVSVALETSKQLESQMLMRHYKGFLK